ncbi:MAG TPA: acyl-CoA dehydrogenase family protein [Solirubrobacteraceae bacterium]|nr:acyl-CoA dehydrogenase family protein [Solirubrobacteraceae bacterium]
MDFGWSEEQQEFRRVARDFAQREIAPHVAEYDRDERFPAEIVRKAAELGFAGGVVPTEYGGSGLDYVTFAGLIEEISRTCHAVACALTFPSGLVGNSLLRYGTEEQKRNYLAPLAQAEIFAGAGVTEARSGTDVSDMDTTARRNGGDYVINGAKMWISFLGAASFFLTFAHRGLDERTGRKRICAFIVEKDLPGVSVHPLKNKYGFRPLETGELVLDDVRVPRDALVGEEGQGFEIAMNSVESGRLGVAARAVGLAQACCDVSVAYAKERQVFRRPIGKFQLVQEMISDMACGIESARLLTYRLAYLKDRGQRARDAASMAKMVASDTALQAATNAFQIHGAYAVSDEYPVGRYLRDAKIFQIVEGNNQLHKSLVAEAHLGMR